MAKSSEPTIGRHFVKLSTHFDLRIFEAAAAEASRWRSVACCRELLRLAGLAGVQKSEKFLVLLVRGHSNDHKAMQSIVGEILRNGFLDIGHRLSFLENLAFL